MIRAISMMKGLFNQESFKKTVLDHCFSLYHEDKHKLAHRSLMVSTDLWG